jgi:quercetin dioxygenase-like cupin family protein
MFEQQPITSSGAVVPPTSGKTIRLGGTQHTFKLVGADTGGQFALMEATMQPRVLVIPHLHTNEDELTIVLEGEGGVRIGDQEFRVGPGSYIFIPRGTLHAVWNPSDSPGRAITIFSPAGLETFFEEMSDAFQASSPPDGSKLGAISQKYGIISHMEWVPELSAKYGVKMG